MSRWRRGRGEGAVALRGDRRARRPPCHLAGGAEGTRRAGAGRRCGFVLADRTRRRGPDAAVPGADRLPTGCWLDTHDAGRSGRRRRSKGEGPGRGRIATRANLVNRSIVAGHRRGRHEATVGRPARGRAERERAANIRSCRDAGPTADEANGGHRRIPVRGFGLSASNGKDGSEGRRQDGGIASASNPTAIQG